MHTKNIEPAAIEGGMHFETKLNLSAFKHTSLQILNILFPKFNLEQNL